MNVQHPPFDNVKVRQAIAYAIPVSEDHGRGAVRPRQADVRRGRRTRRPKSPGRSRTNSTPISPRPSSFSPRPAIRTAFETDQISFDLGFAGVNEPLCVLVQESLAQIGIKTTINKVPGANWRTELTKKNMPLFTNVFSGWLDYPEYFFYLVLSRPEIDLQHHGLPVAGDGRASSTARASAAATGDTADLR